LAATAIPQHWRLANCWALANLSCDSVTGLTWLIWLESRMQYQSLISHSHLTIYLLELAQIYSSAGCQTFSNPLPSPPQSPPLPSPPQSPSPQRGGWAPPMTQEIGTPINEREMRASLVQPCLPLVSHAPFCL
jgi:hypothetical protein